MSEHRRDEDESLADRRAAAEAQQAEGDFAEEHTPSPTDPPIAEAETPGGEDDGYSPQTEIPGLPGWLSRLLSVMGRAGGDAAGRVRRS
ncbi:MAG TPA: hypothetical protein VIL71_22500 [Spirillospora sp.]